MSDDQSDPWSSLARAHPKRQTGWTKEVESMLGPSRRIPCYMLDCTRLDLRSSDMPFIGTELGV